MCWTCWPVDLVSPPPSPAHGQIPGNRSWAPMRWMCPKLDIARPQFWVKMLLNPRVVAAVLVSDQFGSCHLIDNLLEVNNNFTTFHFFQFLWNQRTQQKRDLVRLGPNKTFFVALMACFVPNFKELSNTLHRIWQIFLTDSWMLHFKKKIFSSVCKSYRMYKFNWVS